MSESLLMTKCLLLLPPRATWVPTLALTLDFAIELGWGTLLGFQQPPWLSLPQLHKELR